MDIEGHFSKQTLKHYSHIRVGFERHVVRSSEFRSSLRFASVATPAPLKRKI